MFSGEASLLKEIFGQKYGPSFLVSMSGILPGAREKGHGRKRGNVTFATRPISPDFFCRKRYQQIKDEWCGVPEVFDRSDIIEERHRIDVDCRRTDRTQPLFSTAYEDDAVDGKTGNEYRRFTTIAPQMSVIGAQSPSNEHIDRLAGILLTYNFYDKELGEYTSSGSPMMCYSMRENRLRTGHVGPLRPFVRCHGLRRGVDLLVLCGSYEAYGECIQYL